MKKIINIVAMCMVASIFVGCGVKKEPVYIAPDKSVIKPTKQTK